MPGALPTLPVPGRPEVDAPRAVSDPRGRRRALSRSGSSASRPAASSSSTSASCPPRRSTSSAATAADVADAIRTMVVRGAPAIGIAAAYGIALAAEQRRGSRCRRRRAPRARGRPRSTSPGRSTRCAATRRPSTPGRSTATRSTAAARWRRTRPRCFSPGTRALTHCNAGGLATGGYGSAVGALLAAWERDLLVHVWVDETRPLLQGARLTAWELEDGGYPALRDRGLRSGVADGRRRGRRRLHRRRPDRRQRRHGEQDRHVRRSPCSPPTTGSRSTSSRPARPSTIGDRDGAAIPIEERDPAEVTARFPARNPAFDVTPAELITAIVTEHGVHRAPYVESLAAAVVAA